MAEHPARRADIVHFDFYFDDWLSGTFELSLELRGALITISALMGKTGLRLRDDPAVVARWMGCSRRKWEALRQALLDAGKIAIEGGFIVQRRAVAEVETARKRRENHANSGSKGGRKSAGRQAKSLNGQDPGSSPAGSDQPSILNLNLDLREDSESSGGDRSLSPHTPACEGMPHHHQEVPASPVEDRFSQRCEVQGMNPVTLRQALATWRENVPKAKLRLILEAACTTATGDVFRYASRAVGNAATELEAAYREADRPKPAEMTTEQRVMQIIRDREAARAVLN